MLEISLGVFIFIINLRGGALFLDQNLRGFPYFEKYIKGGFLLLRHIMPPIRAKKSDFWACETVRFYVKISKFLHTNSLNIIQVVGSFLAIN